MEIIITLPLQPVACPRPRVSKFGTYYPKTYKEYLKRASAFINLEYQKHIGVLQDEMLEIDCTFVFNRPNYMYAKKYAAGRIPHTKRPDVDNLVKATNDVLQATNIIKDDSQIYYLSCRKYYSAKEEGPSITIQIKKGLDVTTQNI